MILSFKTKTNKKPTHFIEKIWAGFSLNDYLWNKENGCWSTEKFKEQFPLEYDWFPVFWKAKPKIHSIRRDPHNRWKPGNKIHFAINVRTPKYWQFAPVIPCISTQKIDIMHDGTNDFAVLVDNRMLELKEIETLAYNDGFDSVDDFLDWFDKDFEGKIIHWTDLKY